MDLGSIAQVARREMPAALGLGKPGSSLEKLTIKYEKGARLRFSGTVEALFNPNEFSLDYAVNWEAQEVAESGRGYFLKFKGNSYTPPKLALDLFFDTYEESRGAGVGSFLRRNLAGTPLGLFPLARPSSTSVTQYTEQIVNLLRIDNNLHRPPICKLLWGKLQLFSGVLTALSQTFSLFQPDGTPVRATLSCTFMLYRSTTFAMKALDLHSADVPKTRTLRAGETLSSLAAEEYGDPGQWRILAAANRIANPRAVTPGQVLRIPEAQSLTMALGGARHADAELPALRISVNGAALPDEARNDLLAVEVHEDVDQLGMFTVQLNNWDEATLAVKWVDRPLFSEGSTVEIQMGYEGAGPLYTTMVGEITGLEPEFSAADPPTLTVRGYDRRHRLLRGHKTRSFVNMKDSDIVRRVAAEAGLRPQVVDTQIRLEYVLQHNQTDLDFIRGRAQRLGYEITVEDRTLYFRPPRLGASAAATLSLGEDLAEFSPRLSTMTQVGRMEVHGWDPKQKRPITARVDARLERSTMGGSVTGPRASDPGGKASRIGVQRPVRTQGEADGLAKADSAGMALAFVQGEGVCSGARPELRAGTVIRIAGAGRRFSGLYYVTSVTHTLRAAQYTTAFTVKRTAT